MAESEASIRGRVMRDMIAHVTQDHLIGKKIKNGALCRCRVEATFGLEDWYRRLVEHP